MTTSDYIGIGGGRLFSRMMRAYQYSIPPHGTRRTVRNAMTVVDYIAISVLIALALWAIVTIASSR